MLMKWIYCHIQEKVVPYGEERRPLYARDYFTTDEMEPTRNPLNSKEFYTSKSKLRAMYKAAGAVEIGDAYDRGYDPSRVQAERQGEVVAQFKQQVAHRMQYGRK
jgi:hypothetical protein